MKNPAHAHKISALNHHYLPYFLILMNDPCMHAFSAKIVVRMGVFVLKIQKIKKVYYVPKWSWGVYAKKV